MKVELAMSDYKIVVEELSERLKDGGGRGTIQLPEYEFPVKWVYTHTRRHPAGVEVYTDPDTGEQCETGRQFPCAMLRTNPPKMEKGLGRERYVQVFNAISDAVWFACRGMIDSEAVTLCDKLREQLGLDKPKLVQSH